MPDNVLQNVYVDEDQYQIVANGFLEGFVEQIISQLLFYGRIQDQNNLTEDDRALIFGLAFSLLANMEDFGGVDAPPNRYPMVAGFAELEAHAPASIPALSAPRIIVSNDRRHLHGGISDQVIDRAFEKVKVEANT